MCPGLLDELVALYAEFLGELVCPDLCHLFLLDLGRPAGLACIRENSAPSRCLVGH